jgi:hypothetical protein
MKIESKKGVHCGKSGILSTVTLPTVGTPNGKLLVKLDVFISDTGNFSISGGSWLGREEYCFGQIEDTLKEWAKHCPHEKMRNDALWILQMWELYHLNNIKAGTPEQHEALSDMRPFKYPESWYDVACEHLKEKGLYEVNLDGKSYKFGTRWLTHPIPQDDLNKLRTYFAPEMV